MSSLSLFWKTSFSTVFPLFPGLNVKLQSKLLSPQIKSVSVDRRDSDPFFPFFRKFRHPFFFSSLPMEDDGKIALPDLLYDAVRTVFFLGRLALPPFFSGRSILLPLHLSRPSTTYRFCMNNSRPPAVRGRLFFFTRLRKETHIFLTPFPLFFAPRPLCFLPLWLQPTKPAGFASRYQRNSIFLGITRPSPPRVPALLRLRRSGEEIEETVLFVRSRRSPFLFGGRPYPSLLHFLLRMEHCRSS